MPVVLTVTPNSHSSDNHQVAQRKKSGGGGDRTRVPQCIREGLYVCSRLFGISPAMAPVDRVHLRLDQNVFNPRRAGRDRERFGIGNWFLGVSDEPPQPGLLLN